MKPHFAECAKEAAEFAAAWSGGDDSPGLIEAENYAKGLKARKEPENGQLSILAAARVPDRMWPIACLKTLSQAYGRKGEAATFTGADVKNMGSRFYPEIVEACQLMQKARKWFGPNLLTRPAVEQKLIGDMDVRLVMHVHGFAKK